MSQVIGNHPTIDVATKKPGLQLMGYMSNPLKTGFPPSNTGHGHTTFAHNIGGSITFWNYSTSNDRGSTYDQDAIKSHGLLWRECT